MNGRMTPDPPRKPEPDWSEVDESGLTTGIDEVGRGAWAGPVVAAAVILPHGLVLPHLGDSKLVTPTRRHRLDREIRRVAVAVGIGWVDSDEIDAVGLAGAIRLSGERALADMEVAPDRIILDGSHEYLGDARARAIVKADGRVAPVAAASIVAKEARDRYMRQLERRYPGFGFGSHVGYGTALHRAAIREHGACPAHRRSFRPVRELSG